MPTSRLLAATSVLVLVAGSAVGVGACGSDGAPGSSGPAGATGQVGPPGSTLVDGGAATIASLPVSCLSPCHGFTGVVSQFETSGHFAAYKTYLGTDTATEWTATGTACGNCHAIDALQQRVAGNVLTSSGGVVANLASGELQYRNPATLALGTSTYGGAALTAEVYCTTCHAVTNANDPHKTGLPFVPGSFPLQIPATAAAINIEKSPSIASVVGTQATDSSGAGFAAAATCMWCHRSRVDVTNYLKDTGNAITSTHWGPHEGPQADVFTGTGGYQYTGKTYAQSTHEQKLTCISCHMVPVAENGNIPDHSFAPNITACKSCHAGATSFDVNGAQARVKSAMTEIETWLNAHGLLTRAEVAPYTALTTVQLGDGTWATDQPVPGSMIAGAALTRDQAGAVYNYILVARGGAFGVHNPIYVSQILWDSYFALAGTPLVTIPGRP